MGGFIKKTTLVILTVLLFASAMSSPLSADDDKGRLIDNEVFYDQYSMTVQDVQSLIDRYPSSCLKQSNYPQGLSWATFREPTSYFDYSASDVSPAQVIWKSSQLYSINPQVILSTLEKEQSLVSGSTGCASWKYNSSMGYNCPDSGGLYSYPSLGITNTCVQKESNVTFSRQVNHAAWQLSFDGKRAEGILDWMGDNNTGYYGRMTEGMRARVEGGASTYYDGYTTIDGTSVYLKNGATAALYNYTPHFSSFVTIFTNWFGPSTDRNPILRSWQSGKMYLRDATGNLYYITNKDQLTDIGYGQGKLSGFTEVSDAFVAQRTVSDLPVLIRFSSSPDVYVYAGGTLHYVGYSTYTAYGSPATGVIADYIKQWMPLGVAATTNIRNIVDGNLYAVSNGSRRYVVGPNAYQYYGLSAVASYDGGPTILSAIPEGMLLAKPGTFITTSNSNDSGIVSETGNSLYPINDDLRKGLELTRFTTTAFMINKYPRASAPLTILSKDSSGNLYLIDRRTKLNLSAKQLATSGYTSTDFGLAPDIFLSQLTTTTQSKDRLMLQIGGDTSYYLLDNREFLRFNSNSDWASFGYTQTDSLTITRNTFDTLFKYNGASLIPNGFLARASNSPQVYLITSDGQRSLVPTASLFANIGYSFDWVHVVTPQSIARIPVQNDIAPYATNGAGPWLLRNGRRRLIPPELVANYNLPAVLNQVTPWHLGSLYEDVKATKFIRIDYTPNVYLVEGGYTYLLSYASYKQNGGSDWTDITPVTQDLFDRLGHGQPRL